MRAYKWREVFINNDIQLIMKRLFAFAFATLVAMCLVSCKQNEVKLHEAVGTVYGEPNPNGQMDGDGIVFHVDDAGYAWICNMTDLKYDRLPDALRGAFERDFTWSVFGSDTVMERDTVWCEVSRDFKHFVGTTRTDSTLENTIVPDEKELFVKYNFEVTTKDSVIKIYPMLRYKAYTERGVQVCPDYTEPQAYNGLIEDTVPAMVLTSVKVEKFIGDTTWKGDTVILGGRKFVVKVNDKLDLKDTTIYRPYKDTVERRTRTFEFSGYSDTIWNNIKDGDKNYPSPNNWNYELDTNWSFSDIKGLGDDGKKNTTIIVNADVPCRQKATPDSSSAARTCYEYFTKNYFETREMYDADTFYKAGQGDWYLPSREELKKLFDARNKVNEMNANTTGFEPLENCYWSSNQKDAKNAWYKCFSDNGVESYIPKANNNYRVYVRAMRKVKWPFEK